MKKLLLMSAAASLLATAAFAQTTVTTTTGTAGAAVQIEPQYRTKIKSYVTEHKIRPVTTQEKIVVGGRVPADVELESVPADWGPSLTKYRYVYSGDRVRVVSLSSRTGCAICLQSFRSCRTDPHLAAHPSRSRLSRCLRGARQRWPGP